MLRRGAQDALSVTGRALSTSAIAQQLPAVAAAPASKGLFAGLLGGSSARVTTPLTDPLPGLTLPEQATPPTDAPQTELTTLANGFKVASENTVVSSLSVIQRCVNLGRFQGIYHTASLSSLSLSLSLLSLFFSRVSGYVLLSFACVFVSGYLPVVFSSSLLFSSLLFFIISPEAPSPSGSVSL